MKVTVIKDSVAYKGKIYPIHETFDIDDVIGQSLIERGYLCVDGEIVEPQEGQDDALTIPFVREELENMKADEVKKLAKDFDVEIKGMKKDEIIDALLKLDLEDVEITDDDSEDDQDDGSLPNTSMPE